MFYNSPALPFQAVCASLPSAPSRFDGDGPSCGICHAASPADFQADVTGIHRPDSFSSIALRSSFHSSPQFESILDFLIRHSSSSTRSILRYANFHSLSDSLFKTNNRDLRRIAHLESVRTFGRGRKGGVIA